MNFVSFCLTVLLLLGLSNYARAAEGDPVEGADLGSEAIFDDRALINGYTDKFAKENKDILLAMINDESLGAYKTAAAVRVFKQRFAEEIFKAEKPPIIKLLIRRLNRSDSAFVKVEIMHTLCYIYMYSYFIAFIYSNFFQRKLRVRLSTFHDKEGVCIKFLDIDVQWLCKGFCSIFCSGLGIACWRCAA